MMAARKTDRIGCMLCALALFLETAVCGAALQKASTDLTELSLEDLMDIEVSSVSRREERLFRAAAAAFVITREDIRRSGATSIPELLRMAPGIQVARLDANKWALSARGFNGLFANKLLVLIDGRSVYTPMYSGVFWESQDVLLDDIERIEVIRGPGATLWGANAVNGIINILTRHAADTRGGLVNTGIGSEERGFGAFRYGGALGRDASYRVFAKYFNRDALVYETGEKAADGWHLFRTGFRADWDVSETDALMLQGDLYTGRVGQKLGLPSIQPPYAHMLENEDDISGGSVLGRWQHTFSSSSDISLHCAFDRTERVDSLLIAGYYQTFDLDFQHRLTLGKRQEIVWGGGYRVTHDDIENTVYISFEKNSRSLHLFSAFFQDDVALVRDRLRLTLGSKLEHHSFTGLEVQPNVRALWTPAARHTAWGAVSRAVRIPGRGDDDMRFVGQAFPPGALFDGSPLTLMVVQGSPEIRSETALAFESGYRVRPTDRSLLDLAVFYNVYDRLRTYEPGMPDVETSPVLHLVVPLVTDNKMSARTWGGELAANWQAQAGVHLNAAYTYLRIRARFDEDSANSGSPGAEGECPRHQVVLRASADLPANLDLDLSARYVDDLPELDVGRYVGLNARLGWRPTGRLELSAVGQNLCASRRLEFRSTAIPFVATQAKRGVYGRLAWRF